MNWEVRRDGIVVAHGPAETLPDPETRKLLRNSGHKIYVDGKLLRN